MFQASNGAAIGSEQAPLAANSHEFVLVAWEAGTPLPFVNFVEAPESSGATTLSVDHASPYVETALGGPVGVGVGVFDASAVDTSTAAPSIGTLDP